jgi:hypothetical protein
MSARQTLAALDADIKQGAALPIPAELFDRMADLHRRANRNRAREAFFSDLLDTAATTLMRLNALGDQLDALAADLPRAPAGSPERVRLRAVLFGLLQGLRCCEVLTPEQAEAFAARMRQGIAEGWL